MHSTFIQILSILLLVTGLIACDDSGPSGNNNGDNGNGPTEPLSLSKGKAAYEPGETVTFTANRNIESGVEARYKYLSEVIGTEDISGSSSWSWTVPQQDYRGYMVELYKESDGDEELLATIGVDVSSEWTKFPRYGFLSNYSDLSDQHINGVLDKLKRHHINGIQFYDWQYKHHKMIAGTAEDPDEQWENIFNEDVYFSTLEKYISGAHERNMNAMFYNLIYGALENAARDGVSGQWYLYTDQNQSNRDKHSLPSPFFKSDIYLLDPSNEAWQNYLIQENDKVYQALDFDGFHMDQLGERGTRYDYEGNTVDLANTFQPFIEQMEAAHSSKYQVLNAVNQYGQSRIADAPTDFLYTEVWDPNNTYQELAQIITDNKAHSNGQKNSVLAAYVNYELADQEGFFNTPSVLFTDAVIFAFGGAHIELGEHMLGKEFFPNDNLTMREDLRESLVSYYDFMVAYENLLRDGGEFNDPDLSHFGEITLDQWPPEQGEVSMVGKRKENKQIIHLLNFTDATTMNWRDNNGNQPYPYTQEEVSLTYRSDWQIQKIWYATPDHRNGASQELEFTREEDEVSFTLPHLKYWSMIVVEFE